MTRKRRTSELWTPVDLWIVRASRHLANGRLIPLRAFDRLLKADFSSHSDPSYEGIREFLKQFAPFFREEQKPLLRRSWKRWIQWKRPSNKGLASRSRSRNGNSDGRSQ